MGLKKNRQKFQIVEQLLYALTGGPLAVGRIAQKANLSAQCTNSYLAAFVSNGYINKFKTKVDNESWSYNYSITPVGIAMLEKISDTNKYFDWLYKL